ncbi:MAG: VWA domain-containing protein [Oscillospiraceae bacterium]
MENNESLSRWRLILGEFAENNIPVDENSREADEALSFLYDNEYGEKRGMRKGGKGSSVMDVPEWLKKIKKLFPKETCDIMQKQALNKYGMTDMLKNPDVLREIEPDIDLLKKLLSFRSVLPENVRIMADNIIRQVVEELKRKLEVNVRKAFSGKKLPYSTNAPKVYRNFNFKRTVERNLKNYSPEYKTIIPQRLYFDANIRNYNPWNVIILVDESGSMSDSVIYSAITASIFSKLPFISIKLVIFDTKLVDLSEYTSDAVETLMKVQLGGGTDIYKALCYAQKLMTAPQKTIVILISDLYDGNDYRYMYGCCSAIVEAGAKFFVLPALDYSVSPCYDRRAAENMAKRGAEVCAVTPEGLAEWIGNVIS